MSRTKHVRLIKWVGDPRLLKEDGWRVANWSYEKGRVINMGDKRCKRHLRPGDGCDYELDPDGTPIRPLRPIKGTGIKGEYHFDGIRSIVEVPFEDARIILAKGGDEFKDVTNEAHPELVESTVIIKKSPDRRAATRT
jgi:hypothetical protein